MMSKIFLLLATVFSTTGAFSLQAANGRHASSLSMSNGNEPQEESTHSRRSLLAGATAAALTMVTTSKQPAWADTGAEVRGIEVNAFNGLIFNYRGSEFGGLTSNDIVGEPSVSYNEFMTRLKAGEVEFVEFLAPDGDAAYATFKSGGGSSNTKPIRIGEGYPIEQHDGWSSPAFAIRAVKNANVPYKFTVPALMKYRS